MTKLTKSGAYFSELKQETDFECKLVRSQHESRKSFWFLDTGYNRKLFRENFQLFPVRTNCRSAKLQKLAELS